MSFKIEFTNEELISQIKSNYSDKIQQSLEQMIIYLRHIQDKDSSGITELQEMKAKNWIDTELYEKLQYLILHPKEEYEIKIKGSKESDLEQMIRQTKQMGADPNIPYRVIEQLNKEKESENR